jgi:hypothetical protein
MEKQMRRMEYERKVALEEKRIAMENKCDSWSMRTIFTSPILPLMMTLKRSM